ncbi:MAG TPA: hypothetical protein PK812_07265 [Beijerinckiaceae bacterium]|nr:hypothetical protein [Beijerinckiaceae bacterium]
MRRIVLLLAVSVPALALAQGQPPLQPGFQTPPSAQPASTPAPADPVPEITTTEVQKQAKTGRDVFIGSYIQVDRTCKVGPTPKIEQPEPPKNGVIKTRPMPINLGSAPGVPRNKCLGVSPAGIAVYYQGKWRFKGEDAFVYRVRYADGRIREVKGTVTVQ